MADETPITNIRQVERAPKQPVVVRPALLSGRLGSVTGQLSFHLFSPVPVAVLKLAVHSNLACTAKLEVWNTDLYTQRDYKIEAGDSTFEAPSLEAGDRVLVSIPEPPDGLDLWYALLYRVVENAADKHN